MTLAEWLLEQIADDEADATPRTVIVSGGEPADEVPNCIGAVGHGCPDGWMLDGKGKPHHWWLEPEPWSQIVAHQLTHAYPDQVFRLAECASKRAIVALHYAAATYQRKNGRLLKTPTGWYCDECQWDEGPVGEYPCTTLRLLAVPYADRPGYDEAWRL